MKTIPKFAILLIASLCTFILVSYTTSDQEIENEESGNAVVVLQFKAQPEKGSEVAENLVTLIESVKEEPTL